MVTVGASDDVKPVPPATATQLRQILGHVPTGVVVVAGYDQAGNPGGLAVGSFTSVSLDPPLVAFYVANTSTSWPAIRDRGAFCVSVLGHDQGPVSGTFARRGGDKFADVDWEAAPATGMPRLLRAHVWVDCRLEREVEIGDHVLVVGEIVDLEAPGTAGPLVFYRGRYHQVLHSAPTAPDEIVYWIPVAIPTDASSGEGGSEAGEDAGEQLDDGEVSADARAVSRAHPAVDEPQPDLRRQHYRLTEDW